MADIENKLGLKGDRKAKIEEARKVRRAVATLNSDTLLENSVFCDFLYAVAKRGEYLKAEYKRDEWYDGYVSALRDIVNGVIVNSSHGEKWLMRYIDKIKKEKSEKESSDA